MKKLIQSSKPFFPKEDIDSILLAIGDVLEEGKFRNAKNVGLFEQMIAEYVGVKNAVAFDSDSSAFETALQYYGVKGKEVIVCTNSFISVPNSVIHAGGRVVFADIREETLSMDPDSLQENISENTCGVIVTHIAGYPNPDLKSIMDICKKSGLFLLEDATHAMGAKINDKKVGSLGDAAVFAFTPTKVLTTGEGGMLVTNNSELSEFAKRFSFYGSGVGKTNFVSLGRHMMLPEISSILGIYQLKRLEEFLARRNEIADCYNKALDKNDKMRTVKCPAGHRISYYKYPLILDSKLDRGVFTRLLYREFGIETGNVFYPPCHLQTVYQKLGPTSYGSLLTSEQVLYRTITLPMHVCLDNQECEYVTEKVLFLAREKVNGSCFC